MATIEKRPQKNGKESFRTNIRKKGVDVSRTFARKEDAELFVFYKERLIENMNNFDVPLSQRITVQQVFELKIEECGKMDKRNIHSFKLNAIRFSEYFGNRFCHQISYDDWVQAAKHLFEMDVFVGAKNENGKRKMSVSTLRRIFAEASSAFSHAQSLGIEVDNHPLKVVQTYITPMMKGKKDER